MSTLSIALKRPSKTTVHSNALLLMAIPLILSGFTHLWNPIEFPSIHTDEGHYLHRAMHILEGSGIQEPRNIYTKSYDHPYFGQIFLAAVLGVIDYPQALNPIPSDVQSIQMLYMVPRVFMGLLAVADTFLIYKILERRYNKNVAFIAAIIFAVMPVSWLLRRILLDNLLLPLLLCSILFAGYLKKSRAIAYVDNAVNNINKEKFLLILFSGIFLGLAIFTKFPAFTFIPLVGCLIFTNNNKSWKILGLWFIPVIGIPLLWPAYAISIGDLDGWWKGFFWQAAGRIERPLWMALDILFKIDPVLIVLGTVGILFAAVKKDFFPLLWVAPFLVLLQVLGYVSYWFFIPILPAVAVGSGRLIEEVLLFVYNQRKRKILIISIISSIYIFGFVSTMMLITTNLNSTYYQVVASIIQHLHPIGSKGSEDKTTLIGNRWVPGFSWIPDFVFPTDLDYKKFYTNVSHIGTDNILLVVDKGFVKSLEEQEISEELKLAYDNTSTTEIIKDDTGNFDLSQYPYTSMRENRPIGQIEIRTNLPI